MFRYLVDDGMLQIMNVNLSDQGLYTCCARTNLDEDNATALLTILGKRGFINITKYPSILIASSFKELGITTVI